MLLQGLFFYIFSTVLIAASIMVITARNPVHSVLYLILAFFNAAALFTLMGAEFLAMLLVIVYVGAVAVLFLFVVMMLNIDFADFQKGTRKHLPLGLLIAAVLITELVMILQIDQTTPHLIQTAFKTPDPEYLTNSHALGLILYNDYFYAFQLAGMILLLAMVGAIVLTLRHRRGVRRQSIAKQVLPPHAKSIELRQVKSGEGVGDV